MVCYDLDVTYTDMHSRCEKLHGGVWGPQMCQGMCTTCVHCWPLGTADPNGIQPEFGDRSVLGKLLSLHSTNRKSHTHCGAALRCRYNR